MISFCLPNKSESIFVGPLDSHAPDPIKDHFNEYLLRKQKTNNRLVANHKLNDDRMLNNNNFDDSILVNLKTSRHSSPIKSMGVGSEQNASTLITSLTSNNKARRNLTPTVKHVNKASMPLIEPGVAHFQTKLAKNNQTNMASSISKCFACCGNKSCKLGNKPNKSQHHNHNYHNQEKSQNEQDFDEQAKLLNNAPQSSISSSLKSRQVNFKRPRPIIIQEIFNYPANNSPLRAECVSKSQNLNKANHANNKKIDKSITNNSEPNQDFNFNAQGMKQNMINLERIRLNKPANSKQEMIPSLKTIKMLNYWNTVNKNLNSDNGVIDSNQDVDPNSRHVYITSEAESERQTKNAAKNFIIQERIPTIAASPEIVPRKSLETEAQLASKGINKSFDRNSFSLKRIRRKVMQKTRRPTRELIEKMSIPSNNQLTSSQVTSKNSLLSDSANLSYLSNRDMHNVSISIKITSLSSDDEESKMNANQNVETLATKLEEVGMNDKDSFSENQQSLSCFANISKSSEEIELSSADSYDNHNDHDESGKIDEDYRRFSQEIFSSDKDLKLDQTDANESVFITSTRTNDDSLNNSISDSSNTNEYDYLNDENDEDDDNRELTEEDIEFLIANTGFDTEQINRWHQEFIGKCPLGLITRKQFTSYYKLLLPSYLNEKSKREIVNRLFSLFDIDGDNNLNFSEFLVSFWIRCKAPIREKYTWIFNMFDLDKNGCLNYSEIRNALSLCLNINDLDELLEQLNYDRFEKLYSFGRRMKASSRMVSSSQMKSMTYGRKDDTSYGVVDDNDSFDTDNEEFYNDYRNIKSRSPKFLNKKFLTEKKYSLFSKTAKLLEDKLNETIFLLSNPTPQKKSPSRFDRLNSETNQRYINEYFGMNSTPLANHYTVFEDEKGELENPNKSQHKPFFIDSLSSLGNSNDEETDSTPSDFYRTSQFDAKKVEIKRDDFLDLCERYEPFRKLLLPIKYFYHGSEKFVNNF